MNHFPTNPFAGSVTEETDSRLLLVSVQGVDRVVQTTFGIHSGFGRQRIIDARFPPLFLKRLQNPGLIRRRQLELFDDRVSQ